MKNGTVTEKSQMHAITTEILRQETCAFLAAKNGFDSYVFLDDGPEKQYLTEYATAVRAQVRSKLDRKTRCRTIQSCLYIEKRICGRYGTDVLTPLPYLNFVCVQECQARRQI